MIYEYDNYKNFVNDWIKSRPKKGRGELQKISKKLRIHPTLSSHIFRGVKDLTLEQTSSLSLYLGLKNLETDYLLLLVQKARAGTIDLRSIIDRQLAEIKDKALDLVNVLAQNKTLSETDKAIFYSNWYYSAIRLLTSIDKYQTREEIYKKIDLPIQMIDQTLDFLVSRNLCKFSDEKYSLGHAITHLESSSPHITRHHCNWRLKAMEQHQNLAEHALAFSAPLTISMSDAVKVRELLVEFISNLGDRVKESNAEELMCINIDWVSIL